MIDNDEERIAKTQGAYIYRKSMSLLQHCAWALESMITHTCDCEPEQHGKENLQSWQMLLDEVNSFVKEVEK